MDNSLNTFKGNFGLAILWDILGLSVIIVLSFAARSFAAGVVGGSIFAIPGIIFSKRAYKFWKEEKARAEQIARELEQKRKEEQERNDLFASGKWNFPIAKFYELCQKNAATDMNNAFSLQKACLLANSILNEEGVPQQYHYLYNSKEKVKEYYAAQHAVAVATSARLQQEYERKTREPQRSNADEAERAIISDSENLKSTYGRSKRLSILSKRILQISKLVQELDSKIAKEESQYETLTKQAIETARVNTLINDKSKKNWGLAGGIADAIAGPGAGAVAAASAMQHNAKIDQKTKEENNKYFDFYNSAKSASISKTVDMKSEKTKLIAEQKKLEEEKRLAEQKVVLEDVSTDILKKFISPRVINIVRNKNNVLEVNIDIKNTYVPEVPGDVKMVVDGIIFADVYSDKIHVGTAYVPFPLYGIPCGKSAKITALCPYYLEGTPKYTLKYTYHKLWVMEQ